MSTLFPSLLLNRHSEHQVIFDALNWTQRKHCDATAHNHALGEFPIRFKPQISKTPASACLNIDVERAFLRLLRNPRNEVPDNSDCE